MYMKNYFDDFTFQSSTALPSVTAERTGCITYTLATQYPFIMASPFRTCCVVHLFIQPKYDFKNFKNRDINFTDYEVGFCECPYKAAATVFIFMENL